MLAFVMLRISITLFIIFFVNKSSGSSHNYSLTQISGAEKSLRNKINNKNLKSLSELTSIYPFYNEKNNQNRDESLFIANSGRMVAKLRKWTIFPLTSMATSNDKKVHVPKRLYQKVNTYKEYSLKWHIRGEKEKLWSLVYSKLKKMGYSLKALKAKNAHSLLSLARTLTKERLSYHLVDKYFSSTYEPSFYWEIKKGDCDKYETLSASIYYLLKEKTGNTEHLYVLDGYIIPPQKTIPHAWNSVIGVDSNNNWYVSAYDLTFADESFFSYFDGAVNKTHVDKNTWEINFYNFIGDPYGMISAYLEIDWKTLTCNQIRNVSKMAFNSLKKIGWYDSLTNFHIFWSNNFNNDSCVGYDIDNYSLVGSLENISNQLFMDYIKENDFNMIEYSFINILEKSDLFQSDRTNKNINKDDLFSIKLLLSSKSVHKSQILKNSYNKCLTKRCQYLMKSLLKYL